MFEISIIRIGHGTNINGFVDENGDIFVFERYKNGVQKKQLNLSSPSASANNVDEKIAAEEIVPLTSSKIIGRYGQSIKLL